MNGKDYYWDEVSQKIGEVFLQNFSKDERILWRIHESVQDHKMT